jgi:hypothetical protein
MCDRDWQMCRRTRDTARPTYPKNYQLCSAAQGNLQNFVGGNALLDDVFWNTRQLGFGWHEVAH